MSPNLTGVDKATSTHHNRRLAQSFVQLSEAIPHSKCRFGCLGYDVILLLSLLGPVVPQLICVIFNGFVQIQDLLHHAPNSVRAPQLKTLRSLVALEHFYQTASVQGVFAGEDIKLVTDDHLSAQETILGRVDEGMRVPLLSLRLLEFLDLLALRLNVAAQSIDLANPVCDPLAQEALDLPHLGLWG